MKKLLSLILAVIMLLSVIPVAYAQRVIFSPEVEQYIDNIIRVKAYENNLYEDHETALKYINEITGNAFESFESDENFLFDENEIDNMYVPLSGYTGSPSINFISVFNKCYQPAFDEIDAKIASGEIKVVINVYDYFKFLYSFTSHYSYDTEDMFEDFAYCTINQTYREMIYKAIDFYDNIELYATSQAEFDAAWKENFAPYLKMVMNCLDGNHIYGEYISNNDATEEADGTKTATCEFCGATDTVVDEGSRIDNSCSCNCHKNGLMGIIWKILKFFYKIFGMNKICSCGVAHY